MNGYSLWRRNDAIRGGDRVVFSYNLSGSEVLDLPGLESWGGLGVIARTIEVGPSTQGLKLSVAASNNFREGLPFLPSFPRVDTG
ncbi:MAG TPA: hypothetical protein VKZ59_06985 [Acidobacteriota bacterium]|nr:hypothetical protein [Acidobacteriota bacterium]